ncbi:unnamed protein product, partial [marine sediment metagenome]
EKAEDINVAGLDILPYDEALNNLALPVARENADIVIVAGRMNRSAVMEMAVRHPFVDAFITNNQSGGFSDKLGTTSTVFVAGKPVYVGSEAGNHLGVLSFGEVDDIAIREFRDVTIGEDFPPDDEFSSRGYHIIKSSLFRRRKKLVSPVMLDNPCGAEQ